MAVEYLRTTQEAGITVYFRLVRSSDDYVFDFDDDTWKADVASCTDPKLAASENTDVGDADESEYKATLDLSAVNASPDSLSVLIQVVKDAATDELLGAMGAWIAGGDWIPHQVIGDRVVVGG